MDPPRRFPLPTPSRRLCRALGLIGISDRGEFRTGSALTFDIRYSLLDIRHLPRRIYPNPRITLNRHDHPASRFAGLVARVAENIMGSLNLAFLAPWRLIISDRGLAGSRRRGSRRPHEGPQDLLVGGIHR